MSISVSFAMAAALAANMPPAHVLEGQARIIVRAGPDTLLELAKRMDASLRRARRSKRVDARPPIGSAPDLKSKKTILDYK